MLINNAVITGSFIVNGVDVTGITGSAAISSSFLALSSSYLATSASYVITSASYAQSSASLSIRTSNLEATSSTLVSASSSFAAQSASLSTRLTGDETNISTLTTASASFAVVSASFSSTSQSVSSRVTLIEGQYATTGSNIFSGPQYINQASNAIGFASTASLYTDGGLRVTKDSFVSGTAYFNNVVVYGTSSIQYITSSQVNFGTNIITVNTDTPAVRFGGLSVFDSGSTQLTGSILWDSQNNHWIYSNPSGSSYNSAMLMNGPRNTGSLGNEQGTLNNYVMKGQGGDHITSSQMIDDGTTVRIPGNLQVTGSLSGSAATFASSVTAGSGFITTGYPAASGNGLFIAYNSAGANTGSLYSYNYGTSTYNPTIVDGSNVYIYNSGVVKMAVVGGSVGIGTTSPGAKLEVVGVDENLLKLKNGSGQPALVRFNDTSTTADPYVGSYGNDLAFGIYGVGESMRINSSRNVGIRTTSPFSLLHVGTRPGAGNTNPSLNSTLTVSNDGQTGIDLGGNVNANNVVGQINWVNYLGVGNYNTARIDVYANGGSNSGDLRFWTATASSSPTIRLTIASTGAATFSSSVTASSFNSVVAQFNPYTSAGTNSVPVFQDAVLIGQTANICKIQYGNSFIDNNGSWLRFIVNSNSATNTPVTALTLRYDGTATFKSLNYDVAVFNSTYGQSDIVIQNNGTSFAVFGSGVSTTATAGASDVGIGTAGLNSAIVFATGTGYTERMRITGGGSLQVTGSATFSSSIAAGAATFSSNVSVVSGYTFINGEGNGLLVETGTAATARTGFMKYGGYEGMIVSGNTTKIRLGHRTDSDYVYGGTPTIREDLVISASGNVLIGGSTSDLSSIFRLVTIGSAAFQYGGSTGTYLRIEPGAADTEVALKADARSGAYPPMTFYTSATERMRINAGGGVGIGGTAGTNAKLHVFGDVAIGDQQSGGDIRLYVSGPSSTKVPGLFNNTQGGSGSENIVLFQRGNTTVGSISSTNTNTAYNTTSDYRLKEDLREINGLDKVATIKVYNFKWKASDDRMDGVLAHELQEVLPYAVIGEKDAEQMQGVDYSKLVPVLIKSIQELSAKVDAQAAEINELKNK